MNLTNKRFGKGVVIKRTNKPSHLKRKAIYWLVQCDCGNTSIVDTTSLKLKRWQSCGCPHEENLLGRRFNKGVVKKLIGSDGKSHRTWLLHCDCGNKYSTITESLISGNTKSCGCLNDRKGKNHPHYKGVEDLSGDYWSKLKKGARIRNLAFEIEIDWAWKLFVKQNKKCALTNWSITLVDRWSHEKQTASLDRIDSKNGYIKNNVQWVHKDINRIKQNYTEDYFISMCEAVAERGKSLD